MKYKVVYETLSGATKVLNVFAPTEEDAANKVLCNYPECFQVLAVQKL